MLRISIEPDMFGGYESPNDWGGWELRSFSSRHLSHIDPALIFDCAKCGEEESEHDAQWCGGEWQPTEDRQRALFGLSYYEHGRCQWYLGGKVGEPGPTTDRWDSVGVAGVLMAQEDIAEWVAREGSDSEAVRESAKGFVATFTEWANGDIYVVSAERLGACDSCGSELVGDESFTLGDIYESQLAYALADVLAEVGVASGETIVLADDAWSVFADDVASALTSLGVTAGEMRRGR